MITTPRRRRAHPARNARRTLGAAAMLSMVTITVSMADLEDNGDSDPVTAEVRSTSDGVALTTATPAPPTPLANTSSHGS